MQLQLQNNLLFTTINIAYQKSELEIKNVLIDTGSFCPTHASTSLVGLADSFPIVMAQRSRRYRAKVAPEYASCGYCASKQRHYYGVKLHLIGDRRADTMPQPRYIGLTDAATHDAPAFEQVMHHLP
jgi:hypothetical protein